MRRQPVNRPSPQLQQEIGHFRKSKPCAHKWNLYCNRMRNRKRRVLRRSKAPVKFRRLTLQMDMETVAAEPDHQVEPEAVAVQTPEGLQVLDLTTLAVQQEESSGEEGDRRESLLPREAK